jgi:hypothetical protein
MVISHVVETLWILFRIPLSAFVSIARFAPGRTGHATGEAVRTLLELLKPIIPPAVCLGAAWAVLETGMKVGELTDLDEWLPGASRRSPRAISPNAHADAPPNWLATPTCV